MLPPSRTDFKSGATACWLSEVSTSAINQIPVLATRRGGLPDVLQHAGFLFDLPPPYTVRHDLIPTAEEMAPWIDMIIRLWHDESLYRRQQQRYRHAARVWDGNSIANQYEAFFRGLIANGPQGN